MKTFFIGLGCFIFLVVVAFGLELGGLQWKMFFAPKHENVRRKVFEETKSYNEGKVQDLVRYRMQYLEADNEETKKALRSTIRHMFADWDENRLSSPELRSFLKEMKYGTSTSLY